ncbi:MAG: HAMP domain-containing histidine kinase [Deltaproteobacteria bacterium]|nr:HAMP domain-containing histidine kinase [Deltaproteobacteria bacterium]
MLPYLFNVGHAALARTNLSDNYPDHDATSDHFLGAHLEQMSKKELIALIHQQARDASKNGARLATSENELAEKDAELSKLKQSLVRANLKLHYAQEAGQAAEQAKMNFLTAMSHELRTPLNGIIGFSQILEDGYAGCLTPRQNEFVRDIHQCGSHLADLINDILTLAAMEKETPNFSMTSLEVKRLIEKGLESVDDLVTGRDLQFDIKISEELSGRSILGDVPSLSRAISHVISNAINFTFDQGKITIEVSLNEGQLVIGVADTGIGLAPEHRERIFDPFYQVRSGICGKSPGLGLGLTLARRIVELHGGKLWAESEGEGKGSRVYMLLPLIMPVA